MSDDKADGLAEIIRTRYREDWETAIDLLTENDMPRTAEALRRLVQLVFGAPRGE